MQTCKQSVRFAAGTLAGQLTNFPFTYPLAPIASLHFTIRTRRSGKQGCWGRRAHRLGTTWWRQQGLDAARLWCRSAPQTSEVTRASRAALDAATAAQVACPQQRRGLWRDEAASAHARGMLQEVPPPAPAQ